MNKLLHATLPVANIHAGLLVLRTFAAGFMLVHGIPKLTLIFSGEPVVFSSVLGMSPEWSLLLAVFAEFLCSVFLFFGFFTRLAAIPLAAVMAVAAFHVHSADPFAVKEKALLFLLIFIVLIFTGGGKISIDGMLLKKTQKRQRRYL